MIFIKIYKWSTKWFDFMTSREILISKMYFCFFFFFLSQIYIWVKLRFEYNQPKKKKMGGLEFLIICYLSCLTSSAFTTRLTVCLSRYWWPIYSIQCSLRSLCCRRIYWNSSFYKRFDYMHVRMWMVVSTLLYTDQQMHGRWKDWSCRTGSQVTPSPFSLNQNFFSFLFFSLFFRKFASIKSVFLTSQRTQEKKNSSNILFCFGVFNHFRRVFVTLYKNNSQNIIDW